LPKSTLSEIKSTVADVTMGVGIVAAALGFLFLGARQGAAKAAFYKAKEKQDLKAKEQQDLLETDCFYENFSDCNLNNTSSRNDSLPKDTFESTIKHLDFE